MRDHTCDWLLENHCVKSRAADWLLKDRCGTLALGNAGWRVGRDRGGSSSLVLCGVVREETLKVDEK